MEKLSLERWQQFARAQRQAEAGSRLHPQAKRIGYNELAAAGEALQKIDDEALRRRVSGMFSTQPKYEALVAVLSSHVLGREHPEVALAVAEAVAGADHHKLHGS